MRRRIIRRQNTVPSLANDFPVTYNHCPKRPAIPAAHPVPRKRYRMCHILFFHSKSSSTFRSHKQSM